MDSFIFAGRIGRCLYYFKSKNLVAFSVVALAISLGAIPNTCAKAWHTNLTWAGSHLGLDPDPAAAAVAGFCRLEYPFGKWNGQSVSMTSRSRGTMAAMFSRRFLPRSECGSVIAPVMPM